VSHTTSGLASSLQSIHIVSAPDVDVDSDGQRHTEKLIPSDLKNNEKIKLPI
jgi:hypothetical protein